MTHTLVSSATRTHIIGFDRPFTVIGERINPTGRKKLAAEMQAGNFETVIRDALAQVAAGAHILDINAGVTAVNPNETEPPLMKQTLEIVQSLVDLPLCIDSSVTSALKIGLETAKGRPLVNSVTGEEEKLEAILPLIAKYNVPVVAISNDETGISEDPDVRFAVAKKIVERAADFGIKPHDIVVDPLVMPIGAMGTAGQQVFRLVRRLREELKVNTTCGASNVSFGMPNRRALTGYFLAMAASHGMTSAIMNPLHDEDMHAIYGANVLNGTDKHCKFWTNRFREMTAAPSKAAQAAGEISSNEDIEARRAGPREAEAPGAAVNGQENNETDALIVFTPSGKRGRFPLGTPVLTAARSLGVDIDSVCGGRAICGRCQINVGEGEFAKHGITSAVDHLSAFSKVEERYDKLRGLASGRRLSCQTQLLADVVIDVPPESQVHKQVVRKAAEVRDIEMDPATRLYFIEVEEADMHKPSSDLERVYRALAEQWDVRDLTCNLAIIAKLQAALKKGEWKITCAVNSRVAGGGKRTGGDLARLP